MAISVLTFVKLKSSFVRQTWLFETLFVIIFAIQHCSSRQVSPVEVYECGKVNCKQGVCLNKTSNICECFPGWTGDSCDSCHGRIRLTEKTGVIQENYGNYTLDTKCSWLIEGKPNTVIRISFIAFATECSWDHLYIYDGNSAYSPLIAVLSGLIISNKETSTAIPEFTARSGYVYLHFYSDAAYNMSGFNLTYSMGTCPLNCSGNGRCNYNLTCTCYNGWKGEGCDIPSCPNNCSTDVKQGSCLLADTNQSYCQCFRKYGGFDCSKSEAEGIWLEQTSSSFLPVGTASHKSVILDGHMWVTSGELFEARENRTRYLELSRYDFYGRTWKSIDSKASDWPEKRYGHSLVAYKEKLYMFGGLIENNTTNSLWEYDTNTSAWRLINPTFSTSKNQWSPNQVIGVVGHTAHVVNGIMYVIFGHSPIYGYVNAAQECNLETFEWSVPNTIGAIVKGGYGHSSVYDESSGLILVHGGYLSGSPTTYSLSDVLYAYNPVERSWSILSSSKQTKYLHSSIIVDDIMLVFGGNTHNDTSVSHGAKCYSTDFMAYDIGCDEWYVLPEPFLLEEISRFGHTAVNYNGDMYLFGGFNGFMLNDLYVYKRAICSEILQQSDCLSSVRVGARCVWSSRDECLTIPEAIDQYNRKVIAGYEEPSCRAKVSQGANDCSKFNSCPSCVGNDFGCVWCKNNNNQGCVKRDQCENHQADSYLHCMDDFSSSSQQCSVLHNCHACIQDPKCYWADKSCNVLSDSKSADVNATCEPPCHSHSSCENCTSKNCMWCSSERRCIESNSYVASFPYGQCMEWTTVNLKCDETSCGDLTTCEKCRENPLCGWCDDGTNTGLGTCMPGKQNVPVVQTGNLYVEQPDLCPAPHWFFSDCPVCQCNGHSTCQKNTSQCLSCEDHTIGDQCELCSEGYFGNPTNGKNCTPCQCNGQADTCNPFNGDCYCRTRGVKGKQCDKCDEDQKYIGNPKDSTCFYPLQMDYIFTFNLSKAQDKHYTNINFLNTPQKPDRDVDFAIECNGEAFFNVTYKSATDKTERTIVSHQECIKFKDEFKYKDYRFGKDHNTTFLIYVYGFTTPFSLQISFSQYPQIDLVHFFVTFFSCFISLLLVAALLWKIKQHYDNYRRRQQLTVEMEQMASRPFSSCAIEIEDTSLPLLYKNILPPGSKGARRKKLRNKPHFITEEPIHGQKASVYSLVIRLPTGDDDYTPSGQGGIMIASALVGSASTRKVSLDHSKADRCKTDRWDGQDKFVFNNL